jgi:predicted 3-demethylubiquinone-9 3-methyltransferase (glyoxalase superfamily)
MVGKPIPCLWFNDTAKEAVDFCLSVFKGGRILSIDYYWERLSSNPEAEQCGWLQDKYGLSWQIVPRMLAKALLKGTPEQRRKVTAVYMDMKKFDIERLKTVLRG